MAIIVSRMHSQTAPPDRRRAPLRDLPLEQQTLPALIERQAAAHGDRPFVTTTGDGARRSYAQLGDRVAAIAGNRVELIELLLGCAWIGAVAVPLNIALRGAQLRHALTNSAAR